MDKREGTATEGSAGLRWKTAADVNISLFLPCLRMVARRSGCSRKHTGVLGQVCGGNPRGIPTPRHMNESSSWLQGDPFRNLQLTEWRSASDDLSRLLSLVFRPPCSTLCLPVPRNGRTSGDKSNAWVCSSEERTSKPLRPPAHL